MKRTLIQLLDALYRRAKAFAAKREIPVAEIASQEEASRGLPRTSPKPFLALAGSVEGSPELSSKRGYSA